MEGVPVGQILAGFGLLLIIVGTCFAMIKKANKGRGMF